eukprot:CAMPEP_0197182372 /NCGR_PEP_ID=MMETSP1423-20130617/6349_1 /TAXON_ID=476441 /ORGANISM="Pseudo-nitzschia heimii, Strain UNC1101" /LENGTH=176 /DNA_ID=CAMNT_0042632785 /DNA_START=58 /DNA_END=588 /DNA_ORIENTATION=-
MRSEDASDAGTRASIDAGAVSRKPDTGGVPRAVDGTVPPGDGVPLPAFGPDRPAPPGTGFTAAATTAVERRRRIVATTTTTTTPGVSDGGVGVRDGSRSRSGASRTTTAGDRRDSTGGGGPVARRCGRGLAAVVVVVVGVSRAPGELRRVADASEEGFVDHECCVFRCGCVPMEVM